METPMVSTPANHTPAFNLLDFAGERLTQLPFSLRILLENALRHSAHDQSASQAVDAILNWQPQAKDRPAVPFYPARVLLQDLTGVPLVVDLAAMRSAYARLGGDPAEIAPKIPVDLVIDHSVQVDFTGSSDAFSRNMEREYERNRERYQLLRWAQEAFDNFRVVPPGKGIIHQINLESLASVVTSREVDGVESVFPDTLVGTDSHTPMINGLGVLGWGVGGIEAIAALLGKSLEVVLPDVIGLELIGALPTGATPTDLTLTIVERLRQEGVVGKFIECFGDGLDTISIPDRAMIANMSPESGATVTLFPVDRWTLDYLRLTGRSPENVARVESYCQTQGLFRQTGDPAPRFTKVIQVNLTDVQPSVAGPFRPNERVTIPNLKADFEAHLARAKMDKGFGLHPGTDKAEVPVKIGDETYTINHGSLLIAAITSCTNTSNPTVMLSAGVMAKRALERGLTVSPIVKCSLMPGSRVVTAYLQKAGLLDSLDKLGFTLAGYGCGSCIGNSGPLHPRVTRAVRDSNLVTTSISSGNRNFEGRIHPLTRANYLASPPLVVAYALAGTVDIDLETEPLGTDQNGQPVFLKELLPEESEIKALMKAIQPELYQQIYADLFTGDAKWQSVTPGEPSALFPWDPQSSYIKEPPYFENFTLTETLPPLDDILGARVLALLGDSVTTDHISPAGAIPADSAAGWYLYDLRIADKDFNSFGARRGNDQVMVRGTFANIRLRNRLTPEKEGGYTRLLPDGKIMTIFEASQAYQQRQTPLIVIAGKEYGTGSSRDWAAKGPLLLGVRAVIAESYERIHRSNLVGMGILPLQFEAGQNAVTLGLTGEEKYTISGLSELAPHAVCTVQAERSDGKVIEFTVIARVDTPAEVDRIRTGGIMQEALNEA
ncbi:aconitate hydratase AcnA [Chloroflexota bacterium]|nr:aconitate hydratase AcnA [Chloroflexota bacterium]